MKESIRAGWLLGVKCGVAVLVVGVCLFVLAVGVAGFQAVRQQAAQGAAAFQFIQQQVQQQQAHQRAAPKPAP